MSSLIYCRMIVTIIAFDISLFGPSGVNGAIKMVDSIVPVIYDSGAIIKQINDNPPTGYEPENWPKLREDTKTAVQANGIKLEESSFTGNSKKIEHFNVQGSSARIPTMICGLWSYNKPMVVLVVEDEGVYFAGDIVVENWSPKRVVDG